MFKKRTLITIIITIIALITTNKYWFIVKPLPVNLDISGKGNIKLEIILNKKSNEEFKKNRNAALDINLDNTSHVDIPINRAKYPKRLKIILSNFSSNTPIVISNLQFRDGKYKIDNIKDFKVEGAYVTSKDNSLILTPSNNTITLIYPDTLHIRASMKFDFLLFSIILILVYLLAYKLSNYVAEFSTIKGKSRVEITFLTIFFIFLFVPMIHINQEDISVQENRTLAKWQPFITQEGEINYDFGKNFNEWFNDRFCLRKKLMSLYRTIKFKMSSKYYIQNSYYYNKESHWAYNPGWFMLSKPTESELQEYFENINKLNNFCKNNNIKLYILVAPTAGQIYTDKVPPFIVKNQGEVVGSFEQYINSKINIVINPYEELKQASKNDYVFSKSDPHWSEYGAFIAYVALMKRIKQDYKDLKLATINDYNISKNNLIRTDWPGNYRLGHYYETFGMDKLYDDYTTFTHKDANELKVLKSDDNIFLQDTYFPKGNNLKIYMIGTSFSENLHLFAKYSFKVFHKRRINTPIGERQMNMSRWEQDILNVKPDMLLIVTQSNGMYQFSELYKENK